ncbi:MAG: hypothetical protein KF755_00945 [Burkholderiaceae bacterium]|nr:hypothetical protein [Burkholderiaceae bacterium]
MENVSVFEMQRNNPVLAAGEPRADFHDEAEQRLAAIAASGKTISWSEMRRYLDDRLAGRAVARPASRKPVG